MHRDIGIGSGGVGVGVKGEETRVGSNGCCFLLWTHRQVVAQSCRGQCKGQVTLDAVAALGCTARAAIQTKSSS